MKAANGLAEDSHELLLTPQGDAYITAASPVAARHPVADDRLGRPGDRPQDGSCPVRVARAGSRAAEQLVGERRSARAFFDPFHLNSISLAPDGNLLVSMRNTYAEYLIDHRTGRVLWTLGGKRSSFRMGPGTRTWAQHDAVLQPDGTVTIFDNGGGLPFVHPQSRGIRERIDTRQMTATLIREYDHFPKVSASVEGGLQLLPDGNAVIGWGAEPYFPSTTPPGARSSTRTSATRSPATARSASLGAASQRRGRRWRWRRGMASEVYASWNGATDVAAWRVLAGPSTRGLGFVRHGREQLRDDVRGAAGGSVVRRSGGGRERSDFGGSRSVVRRGR